MPDWISTASSAPHSMARSRSAGRAKGGAPGAGRSTAQNAGSSMKGANARCPTAMRAAKKPFNRNNDAASSDAGSEAAKDRRARCQAPQ